MNRREFVKALAGLLGLLVKLPEAEKQATYELSVGSLEKLNVGDAAHARQGILGAGRAGGFDGDSWYTGDHLTWEKAWTIGMANCTAQELDHLIING